MGQPGFFGYVLGGIGLGAALGLLLASALFLFASYQDEMGTALLMVLFCAIFYGMVPGAVLGLVGGIIVGLIPIRKKPKSSTH